jgi:hypothetical protein
VGVRARGWWAAAGGYVIVFLALAAPWLGWATDSVPHGEPFSFADDARLHVWVFGWAAHALADPAARLLDANIHHPLRGQFTATEQFASSQLLAVPLIWATGNPILAANCIVFLSYPAGALALFALARAYGCAPLTAWVAGLAFALGPFRVPANLQLPQYLNVHLPLAMLGVRRLRDRPTVARALVLAALLTLGLLSSYYMAVMVAITAATIAVAELARSAPARMRFATLAVAAGGLAVAVLAVVSIPYFGRAEPEVGTQVGGLRSMDLASVPATLAVVGTSVNGLASLVPALLGLLAVRSRAPAARRAARAGALVAAVGLVLLIAPPPVVAMVQASPLRFLRAQLRFAVIVGCGIALLAAAGLELVRSWWPDRGGPAVAVVLAAALVVTRGAHLSGERDRISAASTDAFVYATVGEVTRGLGAEPLLELPIADARFRERAPWLPGGNLEAEAMIGSFRHWLPLLTGHSAYRPAHRALLDYLIARLPSPVALAELVDLTGLRYLLLRPSDYWATPAVREGLLATRGVTKIADVEGWVLLRIGYETRHPEWIAALADGPRRGRTLLGAPLAPLAPEDAVAIVVAEEEVPATVGAGSIVRLMTGVWNIGRHPWPVLAPPGASTAYTVRPVMRWRPAGTQAWTRSADVGGWRGGLVRDVLAHEALIVVVVGRAPVTPGDYELEIGMMQEGGTAFDAAGNRPFGALVTVTPAKAAEPGRDAPSEGRDGVPAVDDEHAAGHEGAGVGGEQ